jgi:hypothetical protein
MNFWNYITKSTLKREIAAFLMGWWMALGTYLMVRLPITQFAPDAALVAWSALTVPILGYATAAFTQDWISKQTNWGGPPSNTETTVKAEVTDNAATVTTTSEQKP